ncbi:hypothetical protein [Couchioplanes azureus]
MRVLRTILGMLLLTVGIPALLVGGAFWAAMQHRDAGGAFSGTMQRVATSGYAVVVDDVDALLRKDAPFARLGDTRLRITAVSSGAPAFVGIAPRGRADAYLADIPRISVAAIDLGTGALPVTAKPVPGTRAPEQLPGRERIWIAAGTGAVDWNPTTLRDTEYSLVIMNPAAQPGIRLESTAGVRPGWLNQATWTLLTAGSILVMIGMIILGWPSRRREVVYIVEPSQVPDLMQAIGAPLPLSRVGGGRHSATHRPRTLADCQPRSRPPSLTWPPSSTRNQPSARGPAIPMPSSPEPAPPVPVAAPSSPAVAPSSPVVAPSVPVAAPSSPAVPSPSLPSPSSASSPEVAPAAPAAASPVPSPVPASALPSPASPVSSPASPVSSPASSVSSPAPGEPLGLITPRVTPAAGPAAAPPAAAATDPLFGRAPDRAARRRTAPQPTDLPIFEASAVGAWVAETAAARARETEARAVAALNASRKAAATTAAAAKQPTAQPTDPKPPATTGPASVVGPAPTSGATVAADALAGQTEADAAKTRPAVAISPPDRPAATGPAPERPAASVPPKGYDVLVTGLSVPAGTDEPLHAEPGTAPRAETAKASRPAEPDTASRAETAKASRPAEPDTASRAGAGKVSGPAEAGTASRAGAGKVSGPAEAGTASRAETAKAPQPTPTEPAEPNAPAQPAQGAESAESAEPAAGKGAPASTVGAAPKPSQPAKNPPRNALFGGPPASAWAATGLTRADSGRVGTSLGASKPADPAAEPADPAAQAKPVSPVEPSKPVSPAAQGKPVSPVEPGKPVSPAAQGKPVSPVEPGKPVSPAAQAKPVGPAVLDKPAGPATQGKAEQVPAKAGSMPQPAKAQEPVKVQAEPAPVKAGTAPAPARPVSPGPVSPKPVAPAPVSPAPAPSRPSVPGPSRPAEPAREPVPSGKVEASGAAPTATAQRPSAWPAVSSGPAEPASGSARADASPANVADAAPKVETRIAGQRTEQAQPAEAKPEQRAAADVQAEQRPVADAMADQRAVADAKPQERAVADMTSEAPAVAEVKPVQEQGAEKGSGEVASARQPVKRGLLGSYKDEVAELLGGAKARRRRNVTASGLPAPDPDSQEPPIKVTRPPRRGRGQSKD